MSALSRAEKIAVSPEIGLKWRDWRRLDFWRDVFLYFWFFSLFGHILELVWFFALGWIFPSFVGGSIPLIAIAAPYGLGALLLMLVVYPLAKKKKISAPLVFLLSMLITSAIEFISSAAIVLIAGQNYFWDYSDQPFNLFGWICLRNSVAFGVAAALAVYFLFPWTENLMNKIKSNYLNIAFWILFVGYISVQIVHGIVGW